MLAGLDEENRVTDEQHDEWGWLDDPVLSALDAQIEEVDDWVLDVEADWREGWWNLNEGDRAWRFTRHGRTRAEWLLLAKTRADRLERLIELDAPKIILLNESRIAAEARAGYWVTFAEDTARQIKEMENPT